MRLPIIFLIAVLIASSSRSQVKSDTDILFGFGFIGMSGGEQIPFGFSFSFGIKNQKAGILSTLSYGQRELIPLIRVAGFSTQLLYQITHDVLLSAGPEIYVTLLGLMKMSFVGNIHYGFTDFQLYFGYSDFSKLNAGIIFKL